jgi:hypothetical protein
LSLRVKVKKIAILSQLRCDDFSALFRQTHANKPTPGRRFKPSTLKMTPGVLHVRIVARKTIPISRIRCAEHRNWRIGQNMDQVIFP